MNYRVSFFTMVWAFNEEEDEAYINDIVNIFTPDTKVYVVELNAPLDIRLQRNRDEFRILHKPSKRDLELSEKSVIQFEKEYRMISGQNEIKKYPVLKLDTSKLNPVEACEKIKKFIHED